MNGGCNSTLLIDTIKLNLTFPDTQYLRKEICGSTISAPPGHHFYLWNDGSRDTIDQITTSGTYWVYYMDSCNSTLYIDTIIASISCACIVSLPNAFSPNNDGHNDYYRPIFKPTCELTDYVFRIFNRLGQLVFMTTDLAGKWDGRFMGVPAELGVYFYTIEYKTVDSKQKEFKKGDITLVR